MSHEKHTPLAGWLLIALVCLWVLTTTGFEGLEFAQSIRWESTNATIRKGQAYTHSEVDGQDSSSNATWLTYGYEVDGEFYESSRIRFAEFQRKSEQQKALGKFTDGSEVVVFYNPLYPKKSVLERRLEPSGCLWFAVSLIGLTGVSKKLEKEAKA